MPKSRPAVDLYRPIHAEFRWHVPKRFNIAQVCCQRWACDRITAKNVAVEAYFTGIQGQRHTYLQLAQAAQQLQRVLKNRGVKRGDFVAIVLPQRFETAAAYMAVVGMGAVAVPLSQLFGPEALLYRLQDSDAVAAIGDAATLPGLVALRRECPALHTVIGVGEELSGLSTASGADEAWNFKPNRSSVDVFSASIAIETGANEPAVLIYTSGTTGPPKGALIPHRALIGNLTGFVASQNWFGFDPADGKDAGGQVFWSPADWAWTGGLMDALLPCLYFGKPIVAVNGRFSPEMAFDVLQKHQVTHTFLFPTALKAMMKALPKPRKAYTFQLQAIMSAGEAVGDAVYAWCERELGVKVNEMFGQTEINYIVGNCNRLWPSKPGSMGKGYPGHRVALIDNAGELVPQGESGEVAVHRLDVHGERDPVFFLGYWKRPDATAAKYTGDQASSWCRTGDLAVEDADGYLWYQGRADDMFKAAGYRIGPGEIENCLVKHPAVLNAAVVPKPDAERGAVVKAFIVLSPAWLEQHGLSKTIAPHAQNTGTEGQKHIKNLIQDLQNHVKGRLAPYEYPKEIEFIEALPMTTTGKVQRRVLRLREEEAFAKGPGLK